MKGSGAKRNVCRGSWVSTGATFPVAPVESAPMRDDDDDDACLILTHNPIPAGFMQK